MKKLAALMLSVAVLSITAPAFAGEREGAFSISPFVGGYTFDGFQQRETAPVYGLRLGYDLTKNWGVELVGDFLATDGTRSQRSVNALSYRLDVLYNFVPDGPLVPYLAMGGGGITAGHGKNFHNGSNTDATANAGFGVKYFLTDSVALRGDARQLLIFEHQNSVMYNWEYTAGLTFLFGGKNAAAPVQAPPPPAPTSKLSVTPGSIQKGNTATLNWTSENASNCDITPGIGPVKPQGSMAITPSADTAYNLSCNGPGGNTASSTNIKVAALPVPTSSLSVNPLSITKGEPATLNWSSENTTNCDITPGIGPVKTQGSMAITPSADTAYNLSCNGPGGNTASSTNIKVVTPPATTDSLSITPSSITKGESATLNWTSQNASKCAIQPVIGSVQPEGRMIITPPANTSYTLTCEGAGGVATSEAKIAVTVPQPAKLCSPTVIDIQFDTNKSDIKPRYHDELKKLADFLTEFPNAKGVIEGHTDSVGDKASNMKLSQRRADSVRNYLIKTFGIAPERLKAEGYGPTRPIADNKTKEGKAQNRRIEANFNCE